MRTPIAVLALLAAAPAPASGADAPRTAIVAAAPGYPGTRAEAQPFMDALAAALQRIAGLPEGALAASYEPTEKGGLTRIAQQETGVALVPLPFFLRHAAALELSPRLQVEMKAGGATEVWTLVAKKGFVTAPASLADSTVVSLAGYAPAFVRGALGAWGRIPESAAISASSQVLSALRKAASGEKVAVLLDGSQAAALSTLPFALGARGRRALRAPSGGPRVHRGGSPPRRAREGHRAGASEARLRPRGRRGPRRHPDGPLLTPRREGAGSRAKARRGGLPMKRAWAALLASAGVAACAPALRPPAAEPPAREAPALSAPELLAAAGEAFARRPDRAAARRSRDLCLAAARADPAGTAALIEAVRVLGWLVEHEPDGKERLAFAEAAVDAGQRCLERSPQSPACAYSLALGVGLQAREKRGTALDGLRRMVELLERAAAEDPRQDRAGPSRVLAMLLVRAPGWPLGPGDAEAALARAQQAVALAPEYPPNQLALAEALSATGREGEARATAQLALERARVSAAADPDSEEWQAQAQRLIAGER
jgi:tetratricopeptide (TPR) repeat protein